MTYDKGHLDTVASHIGKIGIYLFTLPADSRVLITVKDGTKAKTLAQNDAINGLIREMYRVGGDSKPEELDPYLETYDIFREWVKTHILKLMIYLGSGLSLKLYVYLNLMCLFTLKQER